PAHTTLSLHDALPISMQEQMRSGRGGTEGSDDVAERPHGDSDARAVGGAGFESEPHFALRGSNLYEDNPGMNLANQAMRGSEDSDRKSTRLNSSHQII